MTSVHVVPLEQRNLFSSILGADPTTILDPEQRVSVPINSPTSGPATVMVAGDFDRDGNVDLLVRASSETVLRLYRGHGDGKFGPPSAGIGAGANPSALVVAD